jgi:hypothetical protein
MNDVFVLLERWMVVCDALHLQKSKKEIANKATRRPEATQTLPPIQEYPAISLYDILAC